MALEQIKRGDFDVVLLDVKMPGMDGIETLKKGVEKYLEKSDFRYPRLTIQPFFRLSFTPRA